MINTTKQNLSIATSSKSKNIQTQKTWKIATTNIQGLCENDKREIWFNLWHIHNWDIIITTETNSKDTMTKFWKNTSYEYSWTSDNQSIGSRIGIALKNKIA